MDTGSQEEGAREEKENESEEGAASKEPTANNAGDKAEGHRLPQLPGRGAHQEELPSTSWRFGSVNWWHEDSQGSIWTEWSCISGKTKRGRVGGKTKRGRVGS